MTTQIGRWMTHGHLPLQVRPREIGHSPSSHMYVILTCQDPRYVWEEKNYFPKGNFIFSENKFSMLPHPTGMYIHILLPFFPVAVISLLSSTY